MGTTPDSPTDPAPLSRRGFLTLAGGALAALATGCATPRGRVGPAPARLAAYLVPGYRSDVAGHRGGSAREAPALRRGLPAGWDGAVTMLTRLDERDGSVRRALLPIEGHAVTVHPDGRSAIWSSLNGTTLVRFDPDSLALDRVVSHGEAFMGGGHAFHLPDGGPLVVSERRRFAPYAGSPARHHGALVLRDPETLAEIERVSCHGIGPHEIALLDDGRHVAVANYGNVELPGASEGYAIVETSLTIVELATGKQVHKAIPEPADGADWQVRHLAAQRLDRILAILVHNVPTAAMPDFFAAVPGVYEPDLTSDPGLGYFPAPLLRVDGRAGRTGEVWPSERNALRQGQSIVYDAARDQWIASFASSHRIVVVSGASGEVTRVIATDRLGLRYPRGLDLHPDGLHYAVAGSWQDLLLFRLDDHRPVPERSHHTVFFDHSHLAAYAPA